MQDSVNPTIEIMFSSIGTNSCISGNVKIGNNVVIAAGAVVVHDVPDNVTVAGIPKAKDY